MQDFFLGKATETKHYFEEKELDILLNRSDLDGLKKIEGTIYVTGHKHPDSDTVGSCIAYAALLRKLGYNAVPVLLGPINNESAFILEAAGLDMPEIMDDASGLNIFLVDHSEYIQSAKGIKNANIIGIIDHHGDRSVTTANPLIYDARPIGSAATIVWLRYRNYGIEPDRQNAIVLMGAILSDTKNLHSKTTTFADREAIKVLSKLGGISDVDAFYQEMHKRLLSYEGKSDEEIFFTDYKEYEIGGKKIAVGNIRTHDEESAKDLIRRMRTTMLQTLPSTGMDMSFAMVSIVKDDISVTYLVPSHDVAEEILKIAFGEKATFDGKSYKLEPYASRKAIFLPAITDVLKSQQKERE